MGDGLRYVKRNRPDAAVECIDAGSVKTSMHGLGFSKSPCTLLLKLEGSRRVTADTMPAIIFPPSQAPSFVKKPYRAGCRLRYSALRGARSTREYRSHTQTRLAGHMQQLS